MEKIKIYVADIYKYSGNDKNMQEILSMLHYHYRNNDKTETIVKRKSGIILIVQKTLK